MKKAILLSLFLLTAITAFSQSKMACCANPSATQKFAMLAADKKFVMAHPVPLKYHFQSTIGKPITYNTPDGKTANGFFFKAKNPTNNYLLVIHEYWGLNDWIKKESEKLYTDLGDVNVLDLDLYDGKVATTREDAGKFMQAVKDDRAQAIIKGALAYAGPNARIATIGWCFGGGWSLQSALLAGKQAIACVMYYGMPESSVDRLKTLNCDVLGNFASKDQWINTKVVQQFEENMKTAGKKLTAHEFDADHAFSNPSNPNYNSGATTEAYKYTMEFLKPRLK
jgi:carboxymethylenebutenolidase